MHHPGVAVEVENDGCVIGEETGPLRVCKTVRMVARVDQHEEINNVDTTDLEVGEVLEQEIDSSQRLMSADITTRGHDQVRVLSGVGRELGPDTDTLSAVLNGSIHRQILEVLLLISNDYIDVVDRAKTVVHNRKQTVAIRGKVDADDLGALVCDHV
jgi:hypothetical protein